MTRDDLRAAVADSLAVERSQVEKVWLSGEIIYATVAGRRHIVTPEKLKLSMERIQHSRAKADARQTRIDQMARDRAFRHGDPWRPAGKPFVIFPDGVIELDQP